MIPYRAYVDGLGHHCPSVVPIRAVGIVHELSNTHNTFAYHSNECGARNTPVTVDIDRKTRLRQRGATTRNEGRDAHSGMRFFATLVGTARALERAGPLKRYSPM